MRAVLNINQLLEEECAHEYDHVDEHARTGGRHERIVFAGRIYLYVEAGKVNRLGAERIEVHHAVRGEKVQERMRGEHKEEQDAHLLPVHPVFLVLERKRDEC